jgi:hypothetical protein
MTEAQGFPDLDLLAKCGINFVMTEGGASPEKALEAGFNSVLYNDGGIGDQPLEDTVRESWITDVKNIIFGLDRGHYATAVKIADEVGLGPGRTREQTNEILNSMLVDYAKIADALKGYGTFIVSAACGDKVGLGIDRLKRILNLGLDAVVIDQYIIRTIGDKLEDQIADFFQVLNTARVEGIMKGVVCLYWTAVYRGFERDSQSPNDSFLRWPIFVALCMGFHGIGWWNWDNNEKFSDIREDGRIDDPDSFFNQSIVRLTRAGGSRLRSYPTRLFSHVARINLEVSHLGAALRLLETERLFYLPDKSGAVPPGPGMEVFSVDKVSGPPFFIKSVGLHTAPGHTEPKGGLLAFFKDPDTGTPYFMLMNLKQEEGSIPDAVHFAVSFDTTAASCHGDLETLVNLERVGRETGAVELVVLTRADHPENFDSLQITIPGGTAELFKWADRKPFAHEVMVASAEVEICSFVSKIINNEEKLNPCLSPSLKTLNRIAIPRRQKFRGWCWDGARATILSVSDGTDGMDRGTNLEFWSLLDDSIAMTQTRPPVNVSAGDPFRGWSWDGKIASFIQVTDAQMGQRPQAHIGICSFDTDSTRFGRERRILLPGGDVYRGWSWDGKTASLLRVYRNNAGQVTGTDLEIYSFTPDSTDLGKPIEVVTLSGGDPFIDWNLKRTTASFISSNIRPR